ncbi:glutamate receptor 2.7-like [Zingiber officinale]|uniref:glutamate receptor 2.7-like n=1 Tax=Zingiber officinale TaxID=94328 RepID=UPI001C4D811A|nr:glutamate receptor 2.7-like [Zingiber officinale]
MGRMAQWASMEKRLGFLLFYISCSALFFSFFSCRRRVVLAQDLATARPVDVGVILDLESLTGKRSWTSISMALDDFYAAHGDNKTRVVLHLRDSKASAVGAAEAAVDLMKNVHVSCIVGPLTSTEAAFVVHLGDRARVPVVAFSATSPALRSPFFVRATPSDSVQVPAIAALVRHFAWRQVVLVYTDSEYGTGVVPSLIDALQDAYVRVPYRAVIPAAASDDDLDRELRRLKDMPARVFVVHALPDLGIRIFRLATELGMMTAGYVWIATGGISDVLEMVDKMPMSGIIGVRSYVNRSKEVLNFTNRFRWRFQRDYPAAQVANPSMIQLRAYDTVWAVATAAKKLDPSLMRSSIDRTAQSGNASTDLGRLGVSKTGEALLHAILHTRFQGLTGDFLLVDGQLQPSALEIVNVDGGKLITIGFWTPEEGGTLKQQLNSTNDTDVLNSVVWPGSQTDVPRGWEIPTNGKRLRIGVPLKHGFDQFVKVETDPTTNRTHVSGYCIDVFEAVMHRLPYPVAFDYIPAVNSDESYDNLVYQVYSKNFDAVVGDTTILANRTHFVDFTMPYAESGVSMVVSVEKNNSTGMWIFLQPLTPDLWWAIFAVFVLTGFMLWMIERRNNEFPGTPFQQLGTVFYYVFSIAFFAHAEKLTSNLSRFAVIVFSFVVLVLTSSYTASLTSTLTVRQLQPTVTNVDQLLATGAFVGHQDGSYVVGMLERMGIHASKLRNYSTSDQFAEALAKGSARGGVDAVFDEIPYLKLFLYQHPDDFTMVGPTYKTDGFGFVFPQGSPLVPDISRAILNATEARELALIESKWFGFPKNSTSKSSDRSSSSLALHDFAGLFVITGLVSAAALIIFLARFIYVERNGLQEAASTETTLWRKTVALLKHYHDVEETPSCPTSKRDENGALGGDQIPATGSQSPESISNHSLFSAASGEEGASSSELNSPMAESREAR